MPRFGSSEPRITGRAALFRPHPDDFARHSRQDFPDLTKCFPSLGKRWSLRMNIAWGRLSMHLFLSSLGLCDPFAGRETTARGQYARKAV